MSQGIDLTAFDGDVTSLFGELTATCKGITDVPTAKALAPAEPAAVRLAQAQP